MSSTGSGYPRALAVPLDVAVHEGADREWVAWRVRAPGNIDYGFARGERPEGCLEAFLALEQAPLSDFAGFVRRFGVLGICAEHDVPGVVGGCAPRDGESANDLFPRTSLTEGWTVPLRIYQEPAGVWRVMAGTLAAAIRVGAALRAGEPGDEADLERLFGDEAAGLSGSTRAVGEQRVRLGELVSGWLEEAGLRPVVAWPFVADGPELAFEAAGNPGGAFAWPARSLYPELLTQLVRELAGSSGTG
ncbi:MAG: hypothetical protein OXG61_00695 [Chloroflexi bacterium]|nr:hypothetical protein [Chloroflexota bacterium]